MATPQLISQATEFVSKWPQCIQTDLVKGFIASQCGPDLECICGNKIFGLVLIDGTRKHCNVADATSMLQQITPFQTLYGKELVVKAPSFAHCLQSTTATTEMFVKLCPALTENRKPLAIAVIAVTTALALASVIMRIISRRIAGAKLWVDDYLIMIAMAVALGETANISLMIHAGLGRHFVTLNVTEQVTWFKTFWILQILYSWSMTLIKFAIVVFYHRVFFVKGYMRITVYVISVFLVLWFLAQTTYAMLECRPIAKFWDYTITDGKCTSFDTKVIGHAVNGASLALDLVIIVAAIPPLWNLKRSFSGRISLIGIFLVGSLVCIAGVVRLPLIVELDLTDLPWSSLHAIIWLQIETKLGIVSACLPMMLPLFKVLAKYMKLPSVIFRSHKPRDMSSVGMSLVAIQADQGAASSVVAKPRSAGSPVIVQFATGDDDDRAWSNMEKSKDWYSAAVRSFSVSGPDGHSRSVETLPNMKRTASVCV